MKILPSYYSNFNTTNSHQRPAFGSAADITFQYIQKNRFYLLPERMQKAVLKIISSCEKEPTLRDLHLKTYAPLLECKTLAEAQNLFPEFREVLQANAVIQRSNKNFRQIEKTVSLNDLSLFLLKERWGNLKTVEEIAKQLGLKGRSSLGWIFDKIRLPELGKNYQNLLKASDEAMNTQISQKVKTYNAANREKIIEHNRKIASNKRCIDLNKELTSQMWDNMPYVKKAMGDFRREHPKLKEGFYQAFWDSHPELKQEVSRVRRELGEQRRSNKK